MVRHADKLTGGAIFAVALLIFWLSPVLQVTDAQYSLLVSESLVHHGTFALDNYKIPRELVGQGGVGPIYQLHSANNRLYYIFPDGSALLSAPLVAVLNQFGLTASNPDGTYDEAGEMRLHKTLAAFLMALYAVLLFATARLVLPWQWGLVCALGGAFGTQVWSTASRGVWMHTWALLLLGLAVFLLLAHATGRWRLRPVLLGSLLAWAYFVRPTSALSVVAVTAYLIVDGRLQMADFLFLRNPSSLFWRYVLTGAAWGGGLVAYSYYNFKSPLPLYFTMKARRLPYWEQFAANLISPARGLLIYVPVLLLIIYLLIHYRRALAYPRLAWCAAVTGAAYMFVVSFYWPGHSYGPRYPTDALPWLFLLAVLGLQAWRKASETARTWRTWHAPLVVGCVLLLWGVFVNGRGALSPATWSWNSQPQGIDLDRSRIWDWRQPQFLAGLVRPAPPSAPVLVLPARIDFTQPEAAAFLWYGWSGAEPSARWSEATEAALVFGLQEVTDATLEINLGAYLVPGRLGEQTVAWELNGQPLGEIRLNTSDMTTYTMDLQRAWLRERNVLRMTMLNAAAPSSFDETNRDQRKLGVRVAWAEIK